MKIDLVIIDPQNSFCYPGLKDVSDETHDYLIDNGMEYLLEPGELFVPGADKDMERLAAMINRIGNKINQIHITMDSHHLVDIAHPIFLINSTGEHPSPFTIITEKDVKDGVWRTTYPGFQKRLVEYVEKLSSNGRYPLCVWPPHCIIGTFGHNIYGPVQKTILNWERNFKIANCITKGSNIFTEHYSALQADVPDPADLTTSLNTRFIELMENVDIILIAGEARSHCLANTAKDLIDNFGDGSNIEKIHLLEDATSDVPGFESLGEDFIKYATEKGMKITNTVDFLS